VHPCDRRLLQRARLSQDAGQLLRPHDATSPVSGADIGIGAHADIGTVGHFGLFQDVGDGVFLLSGGSGTSWAAI
jgi:hypothetical protein